MNYEDQIEQISDDIYFKELRMEGTKGVQAIEDLVEINA